MNLETNKNLQPARQIDIDFGVAEIEAQKQAFIKKYKIIPVQESNLHLVGEEWYYEDQPVDKHFEIIDRLYNDKTPEEKKSRWMD